MTEQPNWQPTADIKTLKRRAQLLADVRRFFAARNVLEVDTPILSHAAPTAPYLDSFATGYQSAGGNKQTCYLQTSPEFAMKRLLAVGSGSIFQIAHVFRNGELGRLHGPEFTMLEWYRPELDFFGLIEEVDQLLQHVASTRPAVRKTYTEVFADYLQLDCLHCSDELLKQSAFEHIAALPADWQTDRDGWLEMLMSQIIEPQLTKLGCPVFIYDFPPSQAQLAKIRPNQRGESVAARFELYAGGLELANGYDELLDATEQRQRFEQDNEKRLQQGKSTMPIDKNLLAAMQYGLPQCTGVALGLDRLLLLITGQQSLQQVQPIGFEQS